MEKESLWVCCPICDNKTRVKVFEDTPDPLMVLLANC